MKAKCHFTKIDCLSTLIGKKVPVDIVAVVTAVGPLGSVKRQSDGTEFVRRCASPLVAQIAARSARCLQSDMCNACTRSGNVK